MKELESKYFYCNNCKIAFVRMHGGKKRRTCPNCHSLHIVEMDGSRFLETKGIYFNPSERHSGHA